MSRSSARWFIGKSVTSRRFSSPQSSMTMRSTPGAMPPCGGAPYCSARSMPPNFASSSFVGVAGDGEGLPHDLRQMVADRAGRQLDAVADDVVLDRLDRQDRLAIGGVERQELVVRVVRHREGVVREVDLLLLLVPLVHREIDDPAEGELVLVDEPEVAADLLARGAGKGGELRRHAADEEDGVAVPEAELLADRVGALGADVLGDRPGALAVVAEEDVAEAGLALALRPGVHAVAEGAVAAGRRRNRPDLDLGVGGDLAGEDLEAGVAEMLGDVRHLDRVAQVRLVGAVFPHRVGIGDARELRRHRLALAELLEDAAQHRLDRLEHVLLLDEAHLDVELVELAGRAVGARRPRRGSRARSGSSGRSRRSSAAA